MNDLRCAYTEDVNPKAQCQGSVWVCELRNSWLYFQLHCSVRVLVVISVLALYKLLFLLKLNPVKLLFAASELRLSQHSSLILSVYRALSLSLSVFLFVISLCETSNFSCFLSLYSLYFCYFSCFSSSSLFLSSFLVPLFWFMLIRAVSYALKAVHVLVGVWLTSARTIKPVVTWT